MDCKRWIGIRSVRNRNEPERQDFLGNWSPQGDSNLRPADYKSAALPTELCGLDQSVRRWIVTAKTQQSPGHRYAIGNRLGRALWLKTHNFYKLVPQGTAARRTIVSAQSSAARLCRRSSFTTSETSSQRKGPSVLTSAFAFAARPSAVSSAT